MSELYTKFDNVFFEKTRLTLLTLLSKDEPVSYNRFKEVLGLSDGALYSHLEKLREAGYVDRTKKIVNDAVESQYNLTDLGRQTFQEYLDLLETVLNASSARKEKS